jgi:hypothetical protein
MADRLLFVGWGTPARGAEGRALEAFNDALELLARKQAAGAIEHFDVVLLAPNAHLGGYMEIHGTAEQLSALRQDEEFLRNTVDASLAVDDLRHIEGFANEGVARQMALYQEAVSSVPQRV